MAEELIEGKYLKADQSNSLTPALEQRETEGNTKDGTIHNDDLIFLNGCHSSSLNEGEPQPVSTINDNTATFRGKDNSHYNAYDLADADLNSVNFHHPSKESLQTGNNNYVQSIESFSG